MIRRPPRSTRTAHAFPTRRSSDLTGERGARLSGRRARARVVRADRKRADRSGGRGRAQHRDHGECRSEEHTSDQSLMRISYAVFSSNKKNINTTHTSQYQDVPRIPLTTIVT